MDIQEEMTKSLLDEKYSVYNFTAELGLFQKIVLPKR